MLFRSRGGHALHRRVVLRDAVQPLCGYDGLQGAFRRFQAVRARADGLSRSTGTRSRRRTSSSVSAASRCVLQMRTFLTFRLTSVFVGRMGSQGEPPARGRDGRRHWRTRAGRVRTIRTRDRNTNAELPACTEQVWGARVRRILRERWTLGSFMSGGVFSRSEEHTSELQSQ